MCAVKISFQVLGGGAFFQRASSSTRDQFPQTASGITVRNSL